MSNKWPLNDNELRLAMIGMIEGNGHPYSWSAIFNGYDRDEMAKCPYAGIPTYLGKEPQASFGIPGVKVTHVWTDNPEDAVQVAKAALIPNVVKHAEDVIGDVDAVLIATDKGSEHVERSRPFVEAGIPVFVDKPLVDNTSDLRTFMKWNEDGARIMSSSAMRYCKEFAPFRMSTSNLGALRFVSITSPKQWERYGIHALEAVYPILGPGFVSARNTGGVGRDIVHFRHQNGADVVVAVVEDMVGSFGVLTLCGTAGNAEVVFSDTFYSFKAQLAAFVHYLRTGARPFPWEQTVELMRMIVAGVESRNKGGVEVSL